MPTEPLHPGKIFLLDGIGDTRFIVHAFERGLRAAGLPHDLCEFRWSVGLWAAAFFADLWLTGHHQRSANRLADAIQSYQNENPGRPVHLVAHSGGTAVLVRALEQLDMARPVTSAILANSGLSPWYDLRPALARTSAGILSLSSLLDWFMLGIGTTLLGSMDRRIGPAAGMVGFREPTPGVYQKLRQVHWHPGRIHSEGWWGMHVSAGNRGLVVGRMAEWIRAAEAC